MQKGGGFDSYENVMGKKGKKKTKRRQEKLTLGEEGKWREGKSNNRATVSTLWGDFAGAGTAKQVLSGGCQMASREELRIIVMMEI